MPRSVLVAVLVDPASWGNRQLLEGVTCYARRKADWRFILQELMVDEAVDKWLLQAKPAGVIAEITSLRLARMLQRLRVPIVDVLQEYSLPHVPQIMCDDQKVVRHAVDYLLAMGLRSLAFVGDKHRHQSKSRRSFFGEYVRLRRREGGVSEDGAKVTSAVAMLPCSALLPGGVATLAQWLDSLPKPVGVVACDDEWGSQILLACGERGLHVPDEVAVLGVGDDPIYCHMSDPTLSSIDCHAQNIGYRAAAMLDAMMSHGSMPPPITFVEPGPIQGRGSTAILAIPDPHVVTAIRFVRDHACSGLTPDLAASRLGVSRRTLERMFIKHVGHSPTVEMRRVRLERAKELLADTDLPLAEIARSVGIPYVETLHRVFKKEFGQSPGRYRSTHSRATSTIRRRTAGHAGRRS